MKNFRSVIASVFRFDISKKTAGQSRMLFVLLIAIVVSVLLIINSCSPKNATGLTADTESSLTQQEQYEITEIEDNIKNSYARLAAERADICPKLLQRDMGNNHIKRVAEVMVNDHCDYFLYPHTGQQIAVNLDNRQIEALLIVPTIHNFADGEYQVTSYDKHVIRLAYSGATYKPERLNYDVEIIITD